MNQGATVPHPIPAGEDQYLHLYPNPSILLSLCIGLMLIRAFQFPK